jgi:NADH:ubiquinone oxidoreductase subunit 6 (subunit J)
MQRWFLLYPPPSGAALVPHLLFYVIVLMFLWILVLDSLDFADEPSLQRLRENWESAVPVFVVLMASCLMMRNWASAYDRVPVQQEKSDEQTAEKPRSVVEAGSISLQAERDLSRPGGNSEPVRTRTFCGP